MSREVIRALMPPGSIWSPSDDGDLDKLFDGIADTDTTTKDFLGGLALLRNPLLTPDLAGLELEYGIVPDDAVAEATRRSRLQATMTANPGNGTAEVMQANLRAAGFDVYVHENSPPVDPAAFLDFSPSAIFGNSTAVFGNQFTLFGGKLGDLVVNGDTYQHLFFSGTVFAGLLATFGNEAAVFSSGAGFQQEPIVYEVPSDPGYWPLIFFVGGPATRNLAGELTEIEKADVPLSRKDELISLVVKYKPVHSWAGMIIKYI